MAFLCPRQEVYELKVECHSSQLAIVFCALVDVVRNQSQLNCSIGLSLSASVITSKVEFWLMHEQWQLLAGNAAQEQGQPPPSLVWSTFLWELPDGCSHLLCWTHTSYPAHIPRPQATPRFYLSPSVSHLIFLSPSFPSLSLPPLISSLSLPSLSPLPSLRET